MLINDLEFSSNNVVSLDEVGRGCLAGPVVTSSVILPKDFKHELIKDSKKLTEKQRKIAYQIIIENCVEFSVDFIDNTVIDQVNILESTMISMHNCLDKLKTPFDYIIVDGNYFKKYRNYNHTCIIKGDNHYLSIAAASIIAKVKRDEYMIKLSEKHTGYGWGKNKGYGTKEHIEGIKKIGVSEYHRKTFLKNII
jgi:ribonuclease HII